MEQYRIELGGVGGKITLGEKELSSVSEITIHASGRNITTATVKLSMPYVIAEIAESGMAIDTQQLADLNEALAPFGYEVRKKTPDAG